MARILAVGVAALDIICVVDGYPKEDSEVRAVEQRLARGGNAANTLAVLSQLGHRCSLAAVLSRSPESQKIVAALHEEGIDTRACRFVTTSQPPTSQVILNRRTGTRTIIHHRAIPEFAYQDFEELDPARFDWLHFEGRNIQDTQPMLRRIRRDHRHLKVSVEIEKQREGHEKGLFALADLLLFSRDYALQAGRADPAAFLSSMRAHAPHADLVCSWGEAGAHALARGGAYLASPAYPPERVIDTVGAGDTFNAGIIDALIRGQALPDALDAASRLAGKKCGQVGFGHLCSP